MKLGERIRALRKKKYTQEELAELVGVHVNTLIRWEHGDRNPTADKLQALADALGTSMQCLLSETGDPQPIAKNTPDNEPNLLDSPHPYTQAQTVNRGMLIYDLGNGKKIELPPTEASYKFLRDIAIHATQTAAV